MAEVVHRSTFHSHLSYFGKIKSFEKNSSAFLTTFTHITPIQHLWGKGLHYESLIYVALKKKTNQSKEHVCEVSVATEVGRLSWEGWRQPTCCKMIETSQQPKLLLYFSCSLWGFHYCHFLHEILIWNCHFMVFSLQNIFSLTLMA